MKPPHWIVAGLLAGAAGSASAINVSESAIHSILISFGLVMVALLLPLLYIAFRGGMDWADKSASILLLLIVDIVMCGVFAKFLAEYTGELLSLILIPVPGYILVLVMRNMEGRSGPPSDKPAA